jgi:hypothetical protein
MHDVWLCKTCITYPISLPYSGAIWRVIHDQTYLSSSSYCELQKIVSPLIIVEGWYFVIDNHCEKVLLNSFLSFKDQGLKLMVFHGTIMLVPQQILWYWLYFATGMTLEDMYHIPYIASLLGYYLKSYTWLNLYHMLCQALTNITPNIR